MATNKKVMIAVSGGVDSSTAAALLIEAGFECQAVFMITSDYSLDARLNAEKLTKKLNIKLHILDLRKDFEQILDYFINEYKQGRTPNPCVFCNRHIKFGKLWKFAADNDADLLATGHYAKILKVNESTGLYAAADISKDQSYALAMIEREMLDHIIFPLGDYTKNQAKKLAAKLDLSLENQPESQEICFVPDNNWIACLDKRCPQLAKKGNIIDSTGRILGQHEGIYRFTIGQRRGLKIAMGEPYYVVNIDAENNTVTLGPKDELMKTKLLATDVNWLIDEPTFAFDAIVRIRYNNPGFPAKITPDKNTCRVEFAVPISAITPGQLAAFYIPEGKNNKVAGAGWIKTAD